MNGFDATMTYDEFMGRLRAMGFRTVAQSGETYMTLPTGHHVVVGVDDAATDYDNNGPIMVGFAVWESLPAYQRGDEPIGRQNGLLPFAAYYGIRGMLTMSTELAKSR